MIWILILCMALTASPALAQGDSSRNVPAQNSPAQNSPAQNEQAQNEQAQNEQAPSLMERGAQMFLEGLLQEMQPALDDLQDLADDMQPALRGFVEHMGPALRDLMDEVEDWSVYHPPEILPNGDIILRRRTPDDTLPDPDGEEVEI